MERIIEFIGNHLILSGGFALVLVAWAAWEFARLSRQWRELDSHGAVRLINHEDPLILDVSNSSDYAKGHIHGALHMPPSRIEAGNKQLAREMERPVLVYCRNGQVSPQMANRLVKLGFETVYVLTGGLTQWTSDQQPVSRGKEARAGKKSKS